MICRKGGVVSTAPRNSFVLLLCNRPLLALLTLLLFFTTLLGAPLPAHADCAHDKGCYYPYGDGNCPTLGCCGGPGERQCCTGCIGSDADSACAPGLIKAITCQRPRSAGESCGPDAPCGDGLSCDIDLVCHHTPRQEGEPCSAFNQCGSGLQCATGTVPLKCIPFRKIGESCDAFGHACADGLQCIPFIQKCYPHAGDQLFDKQQCLDVYSSQVHQSAIDGNVTLNFGVGSVATAGASGSDEVGNVYGQNGKYGCYLTTCVGGASNLAIGSSACSGLSSDYDSFAGKSTVIVEEAGEGVSFSTSQSLDEDGNLNGTADCVSVSLDLLPIAAGVYTCDTIVRTVIGNTPPTASCKNVTACADANSCQANADINNGSSDPDGDSITKSQSPSGPYAIGSRAVTLTVTDGDDESSTCNGQVVVNDCTRPTISCPAAKTAECQADQKALVNPGAASGADTCSSVTVTSHGAAYYSLGTTQVSYTATDMSGNSNSCTTSVTVRDTTKPSITCAAAQTIECTGGQGAVATFTPTASDSCWGSNITQVCSPSSSSKFPLGTTPVSCSATDGSSNMNSCSSSVTVRDTTKPSITCPEPQTIECTGNNHAQIFYRATASDICWGDVAATCSPGTGNSFALGTTAVGCSTADGSGNTNSCSTTMRVVDTTAPVIGKLTVSDAEIWPPNHQMEAINVGITAADVCDPSITCGIVSVESDEADKGLFGGDLANDIQIVSSTRVKLRAERDPHGNGRVYTITAQCLDHSGNTTRGVTTVKVPHDQRR